MALFFISIQIFYQDAVKGSLSVGTVQAKKKTTVRRVTVKSSPKKMLAKLTAAAAAASAADAVGDLELSSPEKKHAQSLGTFIVDAFHLWSLSSFKVSRQVLRKTRIMSRPFLCS